MENGGLDINFLDLHITIKNGHHEFGKFRKTTSSDILIPGNSFCPKSHKFAAFNAMAHRLASISVTFDNARKEIAIMKHLASVNKVEINIDHMIHKKVTRDCLDQTTSIPREPPFLKKLRWLKLPYLGRLSYTTSMSIWANSWSTLRTGSHVMRGAESIGLNVVTAAASTLVKLAEAYYRCLGIQEHRYLCICWPPHRIWSYS